MKQPIAMRCTKKQFKAIKPKLLGISEIGMLTGAFKAYKYLTNNYTSDGKKVFDFVGNGSGWQKEHQNNIHEEWNEKIFLEACGIEVEKTFSITESQINELSNTMNVYDKLKEWYPEAYESEVKSLPKDFTGWVKTDKEKDGYWLMYFEKGIQKYGWDYEGLWTDYQDRNLIMEGDEREATELEVFKALIEESKKRFKLGCFVESATSFSVYGINEYEFKYEEGVLFFDNTAVFCKGKWAEIIPTITLSEAEQKLGKKIIV